MAPSDSPRQPSPDNHDRGDRLPLFTSALEEKPIWDALCESVRDAWFAPRLPELELTSAPIAIPDRMAGTTNRWAVGTSTLVNGAALALLIVIGLGKVVPPPSNPTRGHHIELGGLFVPASARGGGGGGGGAHDLVDPITGRTPRAEKSPLMPPLIPILLDPKLPIQPAIAVPIDIKLPDNPSLPTVGVHQSPNVRLQASGPGDGAGLGTGDGNGDGPGNGSGYGPGSDQGVGNHAYTPGIGGVTAPVPIVSPEAEFSEEARRVKYQGVCAISIVVDAQGYPRNLRLVRSLGMGLDEKAMEAVRKYRFKPALKNGKPVPAIMTIEVNFRLF